MVAVVVKKTLNDPLDLTPRDHQKRSKRRQSVPQESINTKKIYPTRLLNPLFELN